MVQPASADTGTTHPKKVMFRANGKTKADLVSYYQRIAPVMLPYLADRPLTFKQCPRGVDQDCFFRKHVPEHFPAYVKRINVPRRDTSKPDVHMATADETEDLVFLANQNVVEIHITGAQGNSLETPDQLVFDLDPMLDDFERVRATALVLKEILDSHKAPAFVKTSGRNGLHIHVPILPNLTYAELSPWVHAIGDTLCDKLPAITTAEHLRRKRGHKVYVDLLRNNYAQTIIAPYSVRAIASGAIATPIDWPELKRRRVHSQAWHLGNIFRRLASKQDPWADMRAAAIAPERLLNNLTRASVAK